MEKQYLTNDELLVALDENSRGDNTKLCDCAARLGAGVYDYLRGQGFDAELDEVKQEAVIVVLTRAPKFDHKVGSKPFNYFTTCVINHCRYQWRQKDSEMCKRRRYYQDHLPTTGRRIMKDTASSGRDWDFNQGSAYRQ